MKRRFIWLTLCAVAGLALIACGLLVPAHLRAVDAAVIDQSSEREGRRSVVQTGGSLAMLEKVGPARLFLRAAQIEALEGREQLAQFLDEFSKANPELLVWGGADPLLDQVFPRPALSRMPANRPVLEVLLTREHRDAVLEFLRGSRRAGVQEILRHRFLENTLHFPPASSSAGQALDATIAQTALLFQGDHFSPPLRDTIQALAYAANRDEAQVQLMEQAYLDLLSLGRRLDWSQLTAFIRDVEELETLRHLSLLVRHNDEALPVIFAAVYLSRRPADIAEHVMAHGDAGLSDLSYSLRSGDAGISELLARQQRVYYASLRQKVVAYDPFGAFFYGVLNLCGGSPRWAIALKYLFFFSGAFLLARSFRYWEGPKSPFAASMTVRPVQTARHGVFAVCFLFLAILAWEPFLAHQGQALQFPMRLQFAIGDATAATETTDLFKRMEDTITIISLVLFLTIQTIIYILCLLKLAEIRRQPMTSRLKLRLLDNEENMFDSGLYCGLAGTVAALVLLAVGIIKPSLMAAYSSTLFGIVFVAVLKIFNVRPLRRRLIMESESAGATASSSTLPAS